MDSPQVGSPSAGGSPAAAAATPGVEGVDGMEVARRMVQAAEAAALAAQAATRAVEAFPELQLMTASNGGDCCQSHQRLSIPIEKVR